MSEQLIPTPGTFGENGNFLLERELGAGGMGGVYMGRDKMLDRPVAVKVMLKEYGNDPEFVEKFKKEAQSVARLIHPNIAQVYSYGICDGMPYIAMELASGGSLYSIMTANPGKTDIARVIKICQQVAQALQCATDQGCVHGDVKPENILLDANGNAKLVDFGLAAMQKETDEIWGTPYYISPEKVKKEPIDFRADIYSLGGTLYHALTGVAPFEGDDPIAVVKKRFEGDPKKPSEIRPEITPAIDHLVMKMLALDKENRYPSFEALLEAFKEVLTTGLTSGTVKLAPTGAKTTTGVKRTTIRSRRMTSIRRPGAATTIKKANPTEDGEQADDTGLDETEKPETPENDEEEEGGGNLALKVIGIIVGVIVLIGALAGGLIWYKISDKNAREAESVRQINEGYEKAVGAVRDTVANAKRFADEFDAFAANAIIACEKPTEELKKILPAEIGDQLKPGPSKELLDAIAATNPTPVAVETPVAAPTTNAAPAGATNAAPAAVAAKPATNTVAAAATNAAPAAAKAPTAKQDETKGKEPEKKPEAVPEVVTTMHGLWERAYGCQASAVRIRHEVRKLVARGAEVDNYAERTRENMEKIADLSRAVVEMLDMIKTSKDVENVRKGITFIKTKGEKTVEQTVKRLRIEKLEKDRKEKAEAAAAAEKERKEQQEAERKTKIEQETKIVTDKFEAISAQGTIRQLDWKGALRQLEAIKADLTTVEAQHAADIEIRKINDMKKVQDIFIKHLKGHQFKTKGKVNRAKVMTANEKEIQFVKADGKSKGKMPWQKFYKECPGALNEIINIYIVNARTPTSKYKLNLRDWADAMTGAALTMQIVCADVNGAVEKAEQLAKETVKQFEEYRTTAKEIFPQIEFAAAEE